MTDAAIARSWPCKNQLVAISLCVKPGQTTANLITCISRRSHAGEGGPVLPKRSPPRPRRFGMAAALIRELDRAKENAASDSVNGSHEVLKVFASDSRVCCFHDSDCHGLADWRRHRSVDQKNGRECRVAGANLRLGKALQRGL